MWKCLLWLSLSLHENSILSRILSACACRFFAWYFSCLSLIYASRTRSVYVCWSTTQIESIQKGLCISVSVCKLLPIAILHRLLPTRSRETQRGKDPFIPVSSRSIDNLSILDSSIWYYSSIVRSFCILENYLSVSIF